MLAKKPDDKQPFEELYGKPLSQDEVNEMKSNLVNYVQTLIQMDRQHKTWLANRKMTKSEQDKSPSSDTPPEVIN